MAMPVTSSVSFSTPAQLAAFQSMQGSSMYGAGGGGNSGPGTIDNGPALAYGSKIMDMALDPQQALYGRTSHDLTEQIRAGLAARGLNSSGVGQGIEQQGLSNFNIDWQNNLLGRGVQGAGAYASLAGLAQNIANQGFQNYGALGQSEFRAPQPSIPYGEAMPYAMGGMGSGYPGGVDPFANYQQAPTGWSAGGGDYWGPGTSGYNPNFNWGA